MQLDCISSIKKFFYYSPIRVNTRLVPRLVIEWRKMLDMRHSTWPYFHQLPIGTNLILFLYSTKMNSIRQVNQDFQEWSTPKDSYVYTKGVRPIGGVWFSPNFLYAGLQTLTLSLTQFTKKLPFLLQNFPICLFIQWLLSLMLLCIVSVSFVKLKCYPILP